MGYEVTIKVKHEDLDSKFKSFYNDPDVLKDSIAESTLDILMYCLQDHSNDNNRAIIKELALKVNYLFSVVKEQAKFWIEQCIKENGELHLCGRQFSSFNNDIDIAWLKEKTLKDLLILAACVKTPDYLEDKEHYADKVDAIEEALDICDYVEEALDHEFIKMYKKDDENTEESY